MLKSLFTINLVLHDGQFPTLFGTFVLNPHLGQSTLGIFAYLTIAHITPAKQANRKIIINTITCLCLHFITEFYSLQEIEKNCGNRRKQKMSKMRFASALFGLSNKNKAKQLSLA
jgi:hypothetical protein